MRYAARIEYDGGRFFGWQRQIGFVSVQETLEAALSKVADEPIRVHAAGRTDTGVHATGQVVHFDAHADRGEYNWIRGVNTYLADGAVMTAIQPISDEFHARFSAYERRYRYIVLNRRMKPSYLAGKVTWHPQVLDINRMREAAVCLLGEHDFSAFRAANCQAKSPVKTIREFALMQKGHWIWFDLSANAFLYHMVRNLAGSLFKVGVGEREPAWIAEVLASKDRTKAGITAPADGLYFTHACYDDQFGLPAEAERPRFW